MDKRIKNRWIKRLLSGKYLQARNALKKTRSDGKVGYCCLGVLEEMYREHRKMYPLRVDGWESLLSNEAAKWAGVTCGGGLSFKSGDNLVEKNDKGASFKQIAGIIKKYL